MRSLEEFFGVVENLFDDNADPDEIKEAFAAGFNGWDHRDQLDTESDEHYQTLQFAYDLGMNSLDFNDAESFAKFVK